MKLSKWFCREQEENFKSPPKEFSLLPFWAWKDSLKSDKICHQIDEMLDKGVYGAFMHARAGIEDCDTPSLTTIKRDVAEKVKYFFDNSGIVITLNILPMNSTEKGENDGYVINIFSKIFGFDPRSVRISYFEIDSAFRREYTVNTNSNRIGLTRKGFLF